MKKMTDKRKKEILKLINDLHFEFGTKNPIRLCKGLGIELVSANIEMKGLYTEVFSSKLIIIQNLLDDFAKLFAEHPSDMIGFFIRELDRPNMSKLDKKALYYGINALLRTTDERGKT